MLGAQISTLYWILIPGSCLGYLSKVIHTEGINNWYRVKIRRLVIVAKTNGLPLATRRRPTEKTVASPVIVPFPDCFASYCCERSAVLYTIYLLFKGVYATRA